jgi:heme/copper-type cytochrome/quinol oxidase subunit 1
MKPINDAYMHRGAKRALLVMVLVLQLVPFMAAAQNLGNAPVMNRAVQGQQASQPEGAILNMVNWIGNVVAPISAALCVVMAVVSYSQGRGVMRWLITAAGLLAISGLTRLIEFWINQGTAGVQ